MKISVSMKALLSWLEILPLSFLSLPFVLSFLHGSMSFWWVSGGLWAPSLSLHGGKNHLSLLWGTQPSPPLSLLMVSADPFLSLF